MRRKIFIGLIGLIGLIGPITESFAQSELSSPNYKLESPIFSAENTFISGGEFPAPIISAEGPQITSVKDTTATIKWTTDKSSNSLVFYGASENNLDQEAGKSRELTKDHEVVLIGLNPETAYFFKVTSKDKGGNTGQSSTKSFTTKKSSGIFGVKITDITLVSAILSFTTSSIVNAVINYGATQDFGSQIKESSGSLTTNHVFQFTGLDPGTKYFVQVTVEDEFANKKNSDIYELATLPKPDIKSISLKNVIASEATVAIQANTDVSAQIAYYTNEPVEILGTKPGEKRVEGSTTKTNTHEIKLRGLVGNAKYLYTVLLEDKFGNRTEVGENTFSTPQDTSAPKLTAPRVEQSGASQESKDKVQMIISWQTDEPASSQIFYSVGQFNPETAAKTPESTGLVTNHFVILELQPSTSYSIQAASKDHAGNIGKSQVVTVLTPKRRRTIFQFVIERLNETFGAVFRIFSR